MPSSCGDVAAPSVESVSADQEAVGDSFGRLSLHLLNLSGERRNVLGVLENRNPKVRVVSGDSLEPLEHFETVNLEAVLGEEVIGQKRRPNAVRMQNAANRFGPLSEYDVQHRFG